MEIILKILSVALVVFGMIGFLTMIAVLGAMLLVSRGATLTFGYEQDDEDK